MEEKGVALAHGHKPVIMVEECVDRHYVGHLQSDAQRIYFERDEFSIKMLEAVDMIEKMIESET